MARRPAEALRSRINAQIQKARRRGARFRLISVRSLQEWRGLAKSIDGRFRLDGSKKNKRVKK